MILLDRTCIKIYADEEDFLQGLMTQDCTVMEAKKELRYGLFLNAQGRFLYDVFFFKLCDDAFILDVHTPWAEGLLKLLSFYNMRKKVTIERLNQWMVGAFLDKDSPPPTHEHVLKFDDPRTPLMGQRFYYKKDVDTLDKGDNTRDTDLNNFFSSSTDVMTYHHHRWLSGVVEGPFDLVQQRSIPVECGMDRLSSISWTKGCYIGQELTARTHYGQLVLRKEMVPIAFKDPKGIWKNQPPTGFPLTVRDQHEKEIMLLHHIYPYSFDSFDGFGFGLIPKHYIQSLTTNVITTDHGIHLWIKKEAS